MNLFGKTWIYRVGRALKIGRRLFRKSTRFKLVVFRQVNFFFLLVVFGRASWDLGLVMFVIFLWIENVDYYNRSNRKLSMRLAYQNTRFAHAMVIFHAGLIRYILTR